MLQQILWIIITIIETIIIIKASRKNKEKTIKVIKIILIYMFLQRLVMQLIKTYLKLETPYWRAIVPIHLCSLMIYILPIVVCLNIKKIKEPIYFLSIIGGVVTILMGDYFGKNVFSFSDFEGVFAHTMLVVISIGMIWIEKSKFDIKEVFKTIVIFAIIGIWCTTINCILGISRQESNYLYLVTNMLPNNIGGKYFVLIYEIIFFAILLITYLIRNRNELKNIKTEVIKQKGEIILAIINIIILSFTLIQLNQKYAISKNAKEESDVSVAATIYQVRNLIENGELDIEKQIENIFKDIVGRETEVTEKDKSVEIIFKDNNKKIEIKKTSLNLIESKKEFIIQTIVFKVILIIQLVIICIDMLFIIIKYVKEKRLHTSNQ